MGPSVLADARAYLYTGPRLAPLQQEARRVGLYEDPVGDAEGEALLRKLLEGIE
jgi:hypothetical protein